MTYTYDYSDSSHMAKPVDAIGALTNMTYDTGPHLLKQVEPDVDEPTSVVEAAS